MFKWVKSLFFGKDLGSVLNETKSIRVHGVKFKIKKIDPVAFLDGSAVLFQQFDIYKIKKGEEIKTNNAALLAKFKDHCRDVFMSSIVYPKLTRKQDGVTEEIWFVDYLFTDWNFANELYGRIVEFTYGKKKLRPSS